MLRSRISHARIIEYIEHLLRGDGRICELLVSCALFTIHPSYYEVKDAVIYPVISDVFSGKIGYKDILAHPAPLRHVGEGRTCIIPVHSIDAFYGVEFVDIYPLSPEFDRE